MSLRYKLKDGRVICRGYTLLIDDNYKAYYAALGSVNIVKSCFTPEIPVTVQNVYEASFQYPSGSGELNSILLTPEQAVEMTGHAVGGVCPFANPEGVRTYLDVSLKRFDTVFPAVGSAASAIELTCDELERCCGKNFTQWVDVCKGWQPEEA